MTEGYWMVHCPEHGPANVRHDSFEQAKREAKRLARENPDQTFYVLQAVTAFVKIDVLRLEVVPPDDLLPF